MLPLPFEREKLTEISLSNILPFIAVFVGIVLVMRQFAMLAYALALFALLAALRGVTTVSFCALLIVPCLNILNWTLFRATFHYNVAAKSLTLLLCLVLLQQAAAIHERYNVLRPFSLLLGYVATMLALSPFSLVPVISALKAILFLSFIGGLIAMVTVMLTWQVHPGRARSTVLAICCIFIIGSILAYPFPSVSRSMLVMHEYMTEATAGLSSGPVLDDLYGLYNGVAAHSQMLGPLLAVLNAFLLSDYLFNLQRGGKLHQALLCCIPILVYLTSSRTAMLTYVGSIFVVWLLLNRSHSVPAGRKVFMQTLVLAACLFLVLGIALSSSFRGSLVNFVVKSRGSQESRELSGKEIAEAFTATRIQMVQQQLDSFQKHPLIGTGFQVSEDLRLRGVNTLADIFSSPVEKGVLATMILEEGGLLGAAIMLCFVFSAYHNFLKRRCYCFLSTFSAFLITNIGEALFFSPSGGGGIIWAICFCALLLDLHRIRYDQVRSRPQEAFGFTANWSLR